ncbi:unnamed protein product [Heligmosomoides polygyrus]|uniref:Uncharacterized protein n=1 Tax=Heligmosomoides polygyrus TaxID=6339 RepID=A0A183GCJ7_HELPZ|nr:unnamed protein product [Heligmosomoides polygyrus]
MECGGPIFNNTAHLAVGIETMMMCIISLFLQLIMIKNSSTPLVMVCSSMWCYSELLILQAKLSARYCYGVLGSCRELANPGECEKTRVATLNVGTLMGRSLVEALERRRVDFCAVQEKRWSCYKSRA